MPQEKRTLSIVARVQDFASKQFGTIRRAVTQFARGGVRRMKEFAKGVFGVRAALVGLIGILATGALARHGLSIAEQIDLHGRWAQKLKVSAGELSELGFAAEQVGLDQEILVEGLKTIQERMDDASRGTATYAEHFRDLGLSITDSNGRLKNAVEFFPELAAAVQKAAADGRDLTLFFEDVVGGSENMLEILLRQGPEALQKFAAEARRLGVVIDDDMVANARVWSQEWNKLTGVLGALQRQILVDMLPVLTALAERVTDAFANNRETILEFFRSLGRTIIDSFEAVLRGVISLVRGIEGVTGPLTKGPGVERENIEKRNEFRNRARQLQQAIAIEGPNPQLQAELERVHAAERAFVMRLRAEHEAGLAGLLEANLNEFEATIGKGIAAFEEAKKAATSAAQVGRVSGATSEAAEVETETSRRPLEGRIAAGEAANQAAAAYLQLQIQTRAVAEEIAKVEANSKKLQFAALFADDRISMQELRKAVEDVDAELERVQKRIAGDPLQGLEDGVRSAARAWTDLAGTVQRSTQSIIDTSLRGLSQQLADVALNINNNSEAWKQLGRTIVRELANIATQLLIVTVLRQVGLSGLAKGGVVRSGGVERTVPVRGFASGGVVNSPTLAVFGEGKHKGEAFVPLPDGKRIPVDLGGALEKMARYTGGAQSGAQIAQVNVRIETPDADSFNAKIAESEATIGALVANMIRQNRHGMREQVARI